MTATLDVFDRSLHISSASSTVDIDALRGVRPRSTRIRRIGSLDMNAGGCTGQCSSTVHHSFKALDHFNVFWAQRLPAALATARLASLSRKRE
jgi:hypothetical protein